MLLTSTGVSFLPVPPVGNCLEKIHRKCIKSSFSRCNPFHHSYLTTFLPESDTWSQQTGQPVFVHTSRKKKSPTPSSQNNFNKFFMIEEKNDSETPVSSSKRSNKHTDPVNKRKASSTKQRKIRSTSSEDDSSLSETDSISSSTNGRGDSCQLSSDSDLDHFNHTSTAMNHTKYSDITSSKTTTGFPLQDNNFTADPHENEHQLLNTCKDPDLLRQRGKLYESAGDLYTARMYYAKTVEIDPYHGKGWQRLSKAEGKIKGGYRKSIAVVEKALEFMPDNVHLWQTKGLLASKMGKLSVAREFFRKGLQCNPRYVPLLSTWGRIEALAGNVEIARRLFKLGYLVDPKCARLLHAWSLVEYRDGHYRIATKLLKIGLAFEPDNPYILQALGRQYISNGDFEQGLPLLIRAVQINPENGPVYDSLGLIEKYKGNVAKAREYFKRSLNINLYDSRPFEHWALLELEQRNLELAEKLLIEALKLNHKDPLLNLHHAHIEIAKMNYENARNIFRLTIKKTPTEWRCWDAWSALEWHLGNWESAEFLMKQAFRRRIIKEEPTITEVYEEDPDILKETHNTWFILTLNFRSGYENSKIHRQTRIPNGLKQS